MRGASPGSPTVAPVSRVSLIPFYRSGSWGSEFLRSGLEKEAEGVRTWPLLPAWGPGLMSAPGWLRRGRSRRELILV